MRCYVVADITQEVRDNRVGTGLDTRIFFRGPARRDFAGCGTHSHFRYAAT
jgi:hypothetical protein